MPHIPNRYLQRLIDQVEEKRKQSIAEFSKSDLYTDFSLEDLNLWYSNVINLIKRTPPRSYVTQITAFEDEAGLILKIAYKNTRPGRSKMEYVTINIEQISNTEM